MSKSKILRILIWKSRNCWWRQSGFKLVVQQLQDFKVCVVKNVRGITLSDAVSTKSLETMCQVLAWGLLLNFSAWKEVGRKEGTLPVGEVAPLCI